MTLDFNIYEAQRKKRYVKVLSNEKTQPPLGEEDPSILSPIH